MAGTSARVVAASSPGAPSAQRGRSSVAIATLAATAAVDPRCITAPGPEPVTGRLVTSTPLSPPLRLTRLTRLTRPSHPCCHRQAPAGPDRS